MPMDSCLISQHAQEPLKPKMSSNRKSSKPLMEKRRRARINDSLGQLKSLILEATNKDSSRHSKLEKADILEMTVRYLRNTQRRQISGNNSSADEFNRYRLGFSECIGEVSRFLDTSESATQIRTQLIGHLANRCSPPPSPTQTSPATTSGVAFTPARTPSPTIATAAMHVPTSTQQHIIQQSPSPVSSEIRVVLPAEALRGGQLPSHFIPVYAHGAPSLPSPTSSTSSMDTAPSPTQQLYNPLTIHQLQEPTSPVATPQQTVPISYILAPTASPLVGSAAPTTFYQPMTVQSPAHIVTVPAPVAEVQMQTTTLSPEAKVLESAVQHHRYYQSSQQNALRTVQQAAVASQDENVWRPW